MQFRRPQSRTRKLMATLTNSATISLGTPLPLGTTLLERIGNTPLIRLERLTAHLPGIQILGKAEWANPGGSVKDRAASAIVADARERGLLTPGKHLLDATSGNTGIAYAMLGAAMGFPVTLCVPGNVSPERKRILAAYGANVIWTDPADGSDGAIRKARELAAADPASTSTPTSTATTPTGAPIIVARQTKSGSRPPARSRTSSPDSAPAAPSSEPLAA